MLMSRVVVALSLCVAILNLYLMINAPSYLSLYRRLEFDLDIVGNLDLNL